MDGAIKSHALCSSYVERKPLMTTKCKKVMAEKINGEFRDGMGTRLGNGISPCFLGLEYDRPSLNPFVFRRKCFASCL